MKFHFKIIKEDDDSSYYAYCLELKGIYGQGKNEDETFKDICHALEFSLETYLDEKIPIPFNKVILPTTNSYENIEKRFRKVGANIKRIED